jgi:small conductance mechanosensitive channel
MIGVKTTSFIAILWAAWLAVWLALQWSLANFAGGVLILLFKPYKVGDYIQSQWEEGTVDEINIFNTKIVTPENKIAIIPNGAVANGNIVNFTWHKTRRVDVAVWIAYNEDIDKTRKVLEAVLDNNAFVVEKTWTWIYVTELADSSVNLIVRWFAKQEEYRNAFFSLTEEAKKALDNNGISIPFPQRVMHTASPIEKA